MQRIFMLVLIGLFCSLMPTQLKALSKAPAQDESPKRPYLSISTNLLALGAFGTLEADLGVGISHNGSLHLEGIYNPFSWQLTNRTLHHKQATIALQGRYWLWYIYSGWYLAGKLQHSIFNRGGYRCPKIKEGTATGGGIEVGYDWMVGKYTNIEFAFGIWGGWESSKTYASARCGKLLAQSEKAFLKADRMTIALQFVF